MSALRAGAAAGVLCAWPGISRGDATPTLAAASEMRAATVAAKSALQTASAYASSRDATYFNALRSGETKIVGAHGIALTTTWPAALAVQRDTVTTNLGTSIAALAKIDLAAQAPSTTTIRAVLDVEIARLDALNQVLQGIVPSAPAPAPVPAETTTTTVGGAASTEAIATLVPGSGFGAATAQPKAAGTGTGADAKAIARWDVVPYQTVAAKLTIGVVAFHMAGIDRVEFSLNGGPWLAARGTTLNPVTGVWEYNVVVDAATLADGRAEVRAVVHPKTGIPRVLGGEHDGSDRALVSGEYSLFLNANHGGSLAAPVRSVSVTGDDASGDGSAAKPYATIARAVADFVGSYASADDCTVLLAAGDYRFPGVTRAPATSKGWLTIAAAPGAARENVRISSGGSDKGLATKLVRLRGLTVAGIDLGDDAAQQNRIWIDGCVLEGTGPLDATRFFALGSWTGGIFVTDSVIRSVKYPAYGHMLTRNTLLDNLGGDAFREPAGLVVNCEVKNLVNRDDTHNDVVQFWDPFPRKSFENIIFYGMRAVTSISAQALFVQQYGTGVRSDNFAFVNYVTYAPDAAQWQNPGSHVLFWNVGILSPPEALATSKGGLMFTDVTSGPARATSVHNLSVRHSVFQRFNLLHTGTEPALADRTWADHNHVIDVTSHLACAPGTNVTTGSDNATLFRAPTKGDFSPAALSPLLARVLTLLVPCDAMGRPRKTPDAIGPIATAPLQ